MPTIKDALEQGVRILAQAKQQNARLDAQVLSGHVLGVERAALYAYPERELTPQQLQRFLALIERRSHGEPIAYLIGHKEFYNLDLLVDQRVLIPRPETELLVETALGMIRRRISVGPLPVVADIGTGSGAIPIALAVEEPRLPCIYASDISSVALEVARLNCQRYHVEDRVHLLQGDLVSPLSEPVDILIANLPYVGTEEMALMARDVKEFEPPLALFSGPHGLVLLRRFCTEVQQFGTLKQAGVMLLEIGYRQSEPLTYLIHELWPEAGITVKKDYAGWDRFLLVSL